MTTTPAMPRGMGRRQDPQALWRRLIDVGFPTHPRRGFRVFDLQPRSFLASEIEGLTTARAGHEVPQYRRDGAGGARRRDGDRYARRGPPSPALARGLPGICRALAAVVLIPQQMVEDEAARIARAAAIVARLDAEMAKDVARERRLAGQRMKAAAAQQRRWERVKRREGARVMPEFERISREARAGL